MVRTSFRLSCILSVTRRYCCSSLAVNGRKRRKIQEEKELELEK
jgi:hypothetical protein